MRNFFFDLDGTLTDPGLGITNSVMYALKSFGIVETDRKKLTAFIGPPLVDSFALYYGFSEEKGREATRRFQEYFSRKGIFENVLYSGIPEMLCALKTAGHRVMLATSKPEVYSLRILKHFGLLSYFDYVCGATLDEKGRFRKDDVLSYALEKSGADPENSFMIGDRKFDVEAGNRFGLTTVGILYGYGDREELVRAGARILCENVEALKRELLA